MRKRQKFLIGILATMFVVTLSLQYLSQDNSRGRRHSLEEQAALYANASFTERHIVIGIPDTIGEIEEGARAALLATGTNAIPGLRKMLKKEDSLVLHSYRQIFAKLPYNLSRFLPCPPRPASVRVGAALALSDLGSEAKSALPDLQYLLQDPDPNVRSAAAFALKKVQAIPSNGK